MTTQNRHDDRSSDAFGLNAAACRVADLAATLQSGMHLPDYPLASHAQRGIPIYDCRQLRQSLDGAHLSKTQLMSEWVHVWRDGPGVLVLQGAFEDEAVVDNASRHFQDLIGESRRHGTAADHFAKPGANDRVWNALEKLCMVSPLTFATYYSNTMLALACEAWLGPGYQVTSQINCVNPGGAAQMAHRDYHLGFLTVEQAAQYPVHVHQMSPCLTLQGAVAHVDMPLETGPTLYLPHSQKYLPGYLVAGRPDFQAYFDEHHVQLPLKKGDAVFFNPALLHAAGHNHSADVRRMANLLQVSSAFGRAMESVDRVRMSRALYPALRELLAGGHMSLAQAGLAVAACAEGYAFPTNLDRDPPLGGLAPQSQQAMMLAALQEGLTFEAFDHALQTLALKKLTF